MPRSLRASSLGRVQPTNRLVLAIQAPGEVRCEELQGSVSWTPRQGGVEHLQGFGGTIQQVQRLDQRHGRFRRLRGQSLPTLAEKLESPLRRPQMSGSDE